MFEFAISQSAKRRPSKLILASWVASCFAHLLAALLLIQYPQLLQGGRYHRFVPISLISDLLSLEAENDEGEWRTVTILEKSPAMVAPSSATLKKILPDGSKEPGSGVPPIQVSWENQEQPTPEESMAPAAKEAELPAPALEIAASAPMETEPSAATETVYESPDSKPAIEVAEIDLPTAKEESFILPAPGQGIEKTEKKDAEDTAALALSSIPGSTNEETSHNIFENEQKAILSEGSGLFDTKGFPLGDYANLIIERIKGNWSIPSSLRNSKGKVTVVFYIGKNGQFTNVHMIEGSGINLLNLAALNAIIKSNPFPPLPQGFPGDHIGAKFIFAYNE